MTSIDHLFWGEQLAMWLGSACSAETSRQVALEIGFNESPMFGARKARVKLVGELAMVNTALVFYSVNQVHSYEKAKPIIDSFLSSATKNIYHLLTRDFPGFKETFPTRLAAYGDLLAGSKPAVGISFAFMTNMGVDALADMTRQVVVAQRFGKSVAEIITVLKNLGSRQAAPSPTDEYEAAALKAFEAMLAAIEEWPDEAWSTGMRIVQLSMLGKDAEALAALRTLPRAEALILSPLFANHRSALAKKATVTKKPI